MDGTSCQDNFRIVLGCKGWTWGAAIPVRGAVRKENAYQEWMVQVGCDKKLGQLDGWASRARGEKRGIELGRGAGFKGQALCHSEPEGGNVRGPGMNPDSCCWLIFKLCLQKIIK